MVWLRFLFQFSMKMERPSFNLLKDNSTLEKKRQKDYAKSNPMNFDFNMHAYYLIFYIYNTKNKTIMSYIPIKCYAMMR
jgi:hypothetical protein